jgi:hypothetical protein
MCDMNRREFLAGSLGFLSVAAEAKPLVEPLRATLQTNAQIVRFIGERGYERDGTAR